MKSTIDTEQNPGSQTICDAICTACCCLCDDIELRTEQNQIVNVKNACSLGQDWFTAARDADRNACTIEGKAASLQEGIERAAEILCEAKAPLVYGLKEVSTETQRRGAAIADWLGATIDTTTSTTHSSSILGFQRVGKVTCTLGETRNRSRMIVFWGTNVVKNVPRFYTKYSAEATGMFTPQGRADRTVVVVDVQETETSEKADLFFKIRPDTDFEALWTLRSLLRGVPLDAEIVEQQTGVPLTAWTDWLEKMKQTQYGVFAFGMGLMRSRGRHANCDALFSLGRELNQHARWVCRSIRQPGNVTGGDKSLTWRTGFPFGVNFSRGYPRYSPGEYTARELLNRREVDASLVIGCDPHEELGAETAAHLANMPTVVIGSRSTEAANNATVCFASSLYGIESSGTVYRLDDVPLRLRPAVTSQYPAEADLLARLETAIRKRIAKNSS